MGNIGIFSILNEFLEETDDMYLDDNTKLQIISHLYYLHKEFLKYFPDVDRDDLAYIRNPFVVAAEDAVNMFDGNHDTQEKFNGFNSKRCFQRQNLT